MNWLENIRSKPRREKMRLIGTIVAVVVGILIVFWIFVGTYRPGDNSIGSFWGGFKNKINDAKQEKITQ